MELKSIADYLGLEVDNLKLYHSNGKIALNFSKDLYGGWYERTYDSNGNELTYKDSKGITRGFDKKEMTIEEIQQELGYKIKIVE